MAAPRSILPDELIAYTEKGVSVLIGTASHGVPTCMRGMGVRVWPDGGHCTVLAPAATAAQTIADLRANPYVAITMAYIPTHFTFQVKGAVIAIRDGDEADRAFAELYRRHYAGDMAAIGVPAARRVVNWPCHAIDVAIAEVYGQTPGPRAGERLALEERA